MKDSPARPLEAGLLFWFAIGLLQRRRAGTKQTRPHGELQQNVAG